jgi:6-phosphofructokinase 1
VGYYFFDSFEGGIAVERVGVLTSGGDAPGMNNAIRSVVRTAINEGLSVIGFRRGFEGLIHNESQEMPSKSVGNILESGGTVLRTYRSDHFRSEEGQSDALETIRDHELDGLVTIGGDGTMRGARALDMQWSGQVIGIPATIDNDIAGTEYALGFNTAVTTALNAIDHIRDTATSHERTFIVELMGRNSGHIALTAGLAGGAEEILVPEVEFDTDTIAERIRKQRDKGKLHYIIALAEGAASGYELADVLEEKSGKQTRLVVLGHVQRGGTPSPWDRVGGSKMGYFAVKSLQEGRTGVMVGLENRERVLTPLEEAVKGKSINEENLHIANVLSR